MVRTLAAELESTGAGAICAPVFYTGARGFWARMFQAFANSDLSGIMDHRASIEEARRAVEQVGRV